MGTTFKAFENDSQCFSVGAGDGLCVQNGTESVSIYGEARFKSDEGASSRARELLEVLLDVQSHLAEGAGELRAQGRLSARRRGASLTVSGDVDLERGRAGKDALSGVISALEAFCAKPAPGAGPRTP